MSGSNSLPLYSSLPSQLRARYACSEFNLVQSISDPSVCEACDAGAVGSLPPLIGLAAAALLAVGVFVGIAARSPGAMRRWVSTTVILITHVQTVSILSSLHLQWPVWVKRVTATLSFDVVSLPSSSCLFNSGGEAVFPVAALAVCGGVLVVDMLFVCATLSCRHEETAARYEVVLSLVFSLQLTTSWRHVFPALLNPSPSGYSNGWLGRSPAAVCSVAVALVLLLTQGLLAVHFYRRVAAFRRGARTGEWVVPRHLLSRRSIHHTKPRLLERKVAYLVLRFNEESPHWQLVIWPRQALLALLASLGDFCAKLGLKIWPGYVIASVALLVLLIFWRQQRKAQPYVFAIQNAMESWLFGANVLLLLLAIAYAALLHSSAPHAVQMMVEVLLGFALFGGLTAAAAFFAMDARRQRRRLEGVDLVTVLDYAAQKIDKPVLAALRGGSIRLLRCAWLMSEGLGGAAEGQSSDAATHVGQSNNAMRRCQELPEDAFFSPAEAAALLESGERSVLVLSYAWQIAAHPDPMGTTLSTVRRFLAATPEARECGLFWDYASLPQKPRSEIEDEHFKAGLKVMGSLYASVTGTAVLQVKDMPPRPPQYDGKLVLFGPKGPWLEETSLRADLGRFGELTSCEIDVAKSEALACFATHAVAEAAYEALALDSERPASLLYSGRPYDARGWCTFEQAVCKAVASHCAKAERERQLPERYARAQASRAKVVNLSNGQIKVEDVVDAPTALLEQALADLDTAAFTGKGDLPMVKEQLMNFEWTMHTALKRGKDLAQYGAALTLKVVEHAHDDEAGATLLLVDGNDGSSNQSSSSIELHTSKLSKETPKKAITSSVVSV